jgi:uncharacterized C2H2 Zn-finger protein
MKKTIKCSLCNKTFFNGWDYREHWEKKHLDYAIEYAKQNKNVE